MKTLVSLAGLLIASSVSAKEYCEYTKSLDFSADAAALNELDLSAGAGSLTILGVPNATQVNVTATACASSQKRLDNLFLDQRVQGRALKVETRQEKSAWSWGNNSYASITLEIQVPEHFSVMVNDGSGQATISQVASLEIEDGSGSLTINEISGQVSVEDGSGDLNLSQIGGKILISDGSGGIRVTDAEADVFIEEDGSGGITIRNVLANVMIEEDGSGSIDIREVAGDVYIEEDASGSIQIADVRGSFTVDRDSNGGISHKNVAGDVSIPEDSKRRH